MDIQAYAERVDKLNRQLRRLSFSEPVTHVYNPLDYAKALHIAYCKLAGQSRPDVFLLGMNPGPWGMAQTGVPFGEVNFVRDWLGLREAVRKPRNEHPKRPVEGVDCARSEVSGARLWGWASERYQTPQRFFNQFFIANYCPLSFMEAGGRNVTPDKLPADERKSLFRVCDEMLRWMVEAIQPTWLIGVGGFAEKRLAEIFGGDEQYKIGRILHPSPASPAANRDWAGSVDRQFADLGVAIPAAKKPITKKRRAS